ncbi:MAG: hypothetical protein HDT44_12020 [Ruminococcaceae bacterium]|nr:hypothetical protein [Oscillospiraceae bacterium]
MVSFKLGKMRISLDFTFFAVLGLVCAFDSGGYGLLYLAACLCHETAHLAVMAVKGQAPREIIFSGGGICIRQSGAFSFAVLAAGSAANFLLFGIFHFGLTQDSIYKMIFAAANLCVGVFNLLPMGDLDGKRLAEELLVRRFSLKTAERTVNILQTLTCVLWGGLVLYLLFNNAVNLTAVFVMIYIFAVDFFLEMR